MYRSLWWFEELLFVGLKYGYILFWLIVELKRRGKKLFIGNIEWMSGCSVLKFI